MPIKQNYRVKNREEFEKLEVGLTALTNAFYINGPSEQPNVPVSVYFGFGENIVIEPLMKEYPISAIGRIRDHGRNKALIGEASSERVYAIVGDQKYVILFRKNDLEAQ